MKPRVLILGAGISGLACAWYLGEHFGNALDVKVLEKEERAGGWIRTLNEEGFLFELGPRGCRPKDAGIATLQLVDSLGLRDSIITAPEAAHRRYLYLGGHLRCLPHSLGSFLLSPFAWPLVPALARDLLTSANMDSDESVYDFACRRLGRYVAETFMDPLVLGIYGGDLRHLSVRACFTRLWEMEQQNGGLLKSLFARRSSSSQTLPGWMQSIQKAGLFSFREGMQTLPDSLAHALQDKVLFGTDVEALVNRDGHWIVHTDRGNFEAELLISALPLHSFAKVYPEFPVPQLNYQSLCVINMGWNASVKNLTGFGHLVPRKEGEANLGVVWDSDVFPQQNDGEQTRLTVMFGREASVEEAREVLRAQMGITVAPDAVRINSAKQAVPQYPLYHLDTVCALKERGEALQPPLYFLGNSFEGVGVNDCILQAKQLASRLCDRLPIHPVSQIR
ncbi:MAG: protoporphyrinogen oxidase [Chlamydiia bacterium]|nr:protoporphyrinogen oxidase [Chlamydiia bacterium]